MIRGWKSRYSGILREFGYDGGRDAESAALLDSVLPGPGCWDRIARAIRGRDAFVVGAGPSLPRAVPLLGRTGAARIAADTAAGPLLEAGILPEIIVTDLDGDPEVLGRAARAGSIMVVHAHGDNMDRLHMAAGLGACAGTAQSAPAGRVRNLGGFTDGDRCAFLASHFGARRIILAGMDFGGAVGRHSRTRRRDRGAKLRKLRKAEELLTWLSTFSGSELLSLSRPPAGFRRISAREALAAAG